MNYWIQTTEFPPFHGGGISTYCYHTARMLSKHGHQVVIIVPDHTASMDRPEVQKDDYFVVRFNPLPESHYRSLGYAAALSFKFAEVCSLLLRTEEVPKPDYLEVQEYLGIGYYTILRKKLGDVMLSKVPIVVTAHAPSFLYLRFNQSATHSLPDYWTGIMEKWVMKAADIKLSPSRFLIEAVEEDLGDVCSTYQVIRNPFEFHSPSIVRENVINRGEIAFLGKLTYQKGVQDIIQYLDRPWSEGLKVTLRIIGDDHYFTPKAQSMLDHLRGRYSDHFEAGRIVVEGKAAPSALYDKLRTAHLVVIPSIIDNLPYTVVESMAKGKIVLASNAGGQSEVIKDGANGFIFEQGNEESFLKTLQKILALPFEQLEEVAQNARETINALCSYDTVYPVKMNSLLSHGRQEHCFDLFPFASEVERQVSSLRQANRTLSVIVPYYNMGVFVEDALKSIYAANYSSMEVIVVNDGSTDPLSITKILGLQRQYGFKIITQRNAGLAAARNAGARAAMGGYIAFLDPDDIIKPDFFEAAVAILEKYNNVSFVSSWVEYFGDSEGIWPAQIPELPFLLVHNMVCAGIVVKKPDYLAFGLNDPKFEYGMEDYDSAVSMVLNGCRGVVIPEPYYRYRIHGKSMARAFNKSNQLYLYSLLAGKHSAAYNKYGAELFKILMANGPGYLYDNPTIEPATDVRKMQDWIAELEKANKWYSDTLHYLQNSSNAEMPKLPEGPVRMDGHSGNSLAIEIQEWYNKEYEILPKWYKRVGHIVKVAQGKRSFRSLFK